MLLESNLLEVLLYYFYLWLNQINLISFFLVIGIGRTKKSLTKTSGCVPGCSDPIDEKKRTRECLLQLPVLARWRQRITGTDILHAHSFRSSYLSSSWVSIKLIVSEGFESANAVNRRYNKTFAVKPISYVQACSAGDPGAPLKH